MRFNNAEYLKAFPRKHEKQEIEAESAIETFKSTESVENENAVEEFTQVNSEEEGDDGDGSSGEPDPEQ